MGIVLAWAIGQTIVVYRWVRKGAPPTPGALVWPSAFFAGCAALAIYQPAKTVATLAAFGVDIAVLLQVLPGGDIAKIETFWPPETIPAGQLWPNGAPVNTAASLGGVSNVAMPYPGDPIQKAGQTIVNALKKKPAK